MDNNNNIPSANIKRIDYLSWDEYFMGIAVLSAQRSKDPVTQVGACIVNEQNIIVATGYNGMPRLPEGRNDDVFPWTKDSTDKMKSKHSFVCHAEMNAVLNKNSADVKNCKLYVTFFPCTECAKVVVQSGIKEVIYLSDKHQNKTIPSKHMFDVADVKYYPFEVEKKCKIVKSIFNFDWNNSAQTSGM